MRQQVGFLVLLGAAVLAAGGWAVSHRSLPELERGSLADRLDAALARWDWEAAIALSDAGLGAQPAHPLYVAAHARAVREMANRERHQALLAALAAADLEVAWDRHQAIDPDSVYRADAERRVQAVRPRLIEKHLGAARLSIARARYDDARRQIEAVLLVDEANAEAMELAKECSAGIPHPTVDPGRPPPDELGAAMDDYVRGRYQSARDRARRVLAAHKPGSHDRAWRIVGAAACFQHDTTAAREAWDHLSNPWERKFVSYVCERNGHPSIFPPG